ncbi:MAG: hypothetical protein V9H69_05200 [Anaerolineae bacterium]|jgi:hypothetical protein
MNAYPCFSPDDVESLLAQCRAALSDVSSDLAAAGVRLLREHAAAQWPVEWHLPWWLGISLGLPESVWRRLTVCNLLGLGYARWQDQLAEGGRGPGAGRGAVLAAALYEGALAELAELFVGRPQFWRIRQAIMAQWLAALLEDDPVLSQPAARWQETELLRLARRGAPLKITAAGACLLAERADLAILLEPALDHLLTAQVLLDHVDDWQDDLAQGRYNVLVAYASELPQDQAHCEANQRRVLALLMLGDPAGYFRHVQQHLAQAGALAEAAGIDGLARFIASQARDAELGWQRMVNAGRDHLAGAVGRVLASH